jgi:hypothetical protein
MRCHFHVVNASEVIPDETGVEVSGLEEARVEALQAIEEMRQADAAGTNDWKGWSLNVAETTGRVLFSIPLNDPRLRHLSFGPLIAATSAQPLQHLANMLPNAIGLLPPIFV